MPSRLILDEESARRRFRKVCAACDRERKSMSKEHYWPKWLIKKTRTHLGEVRWSATGPKINPLSAKIRICSECNQTFGRELEGPVSRIFEEVEAGTGISDTDAELLVRWLWKFEGLAWQFTYPTSAYTQKYTVRDRVLMPLDEIRHGGLVLAISLIATLDASYPDAPMGLDTPLADNAVCVGGVFSRLVLLVSAARFASMIDGDLFTIYTFQKRGQPTDDAKLIFPKAGFPTCVDAVKYMTLFCPRLSSEHDEWMRSRRPQT